MNTLFRFALVISALSLVLKILLSGHLSMQGAVLVLLGVCFLAAIGSRLIAIVVTVFGLAWLILEITGGDTTAIKALAPSLLHLIVVLFGCYIMFRGLSSR